MAIITLTTDFGLKDFSVAAVKGAIYKELSTATIVDISHNIEPFNNIEAAYIIKNAYTKFPKGSIHIIGIDTELTPQNKHLAILLDEHYFICANNGIMSLLFNTIKPSKVVEITIHNVITSSFAALDVFAKVACHIARGGNLDVIGKPTKKIKTFNNLAPYVNDNKTQLIGNIIYIDTYGNVVTNISKLFFKELQQERAFEIQVRSYKFNVIRNNYSSFINFNSDTNILENEGKAIALFNSENYLEIALYRSTLKNNAATLLGLSLMNTVTINFF